MFFIVSIFMLVNNPTPAPLMAMNRQTFPTIEVCKLVMEKGKDSLQKMFEEQFPGEEITHTEDCLTQEQVQELQAHLESIRKDVENSKL